MSRTAAHAPRADRGRNCCLSRARLEVAGSVPNRASSGRGKIGRQTGTKVVHNRAGGVQCRVRISSPGAEVFLPNNRQAFPGGAIDEGIVIYYGDTVVVAKSVRSWCPSNIAATVVEPCAVRRPTPKSSRYPAPAFVGLIVVPVAIVVGQPAPGMVADPCPAKTESKTTPEPGAVRAPAEGDVRNPDSATSRVTGPVTVTI